MSTDDAIPIDELLAHRRWLNALARRLVAHEAEADDLEQETLVTALERPPRGVRCLRAWLGRVARRTARGGARSDSRRGRRERLAARSERVPSASEVFDRVSRQRRILDAVLGLEPSMRHVVLLRFYEGLTPRQIAAQLGLSANAVRTRLSRALSILRARLQAELGPDFRKLLLPPPLVWFGGGVAQGVATALTLAIATGLALVAVAIDGGEGRPVPPSLLLGAVMDRSETPSPVLCRRAPSPGPARVSSRRGRVAPDTIRIRVVDGVSGDLVRHASVRYLPLELDRSMIKLLRRRWHNFPLLHELEWIKKSPGKALDSTGADGIVELAVAERPVQIWARSGSNRGTRIVLPGEREATVKLWAIRQIRFRVTTTSGAGIDDMPVVLEVPLNEPQPRWIPETGEVVREPRTLWWERTNGNGLASVFFVAPAGTRHVRVSLGVPALASEAVVVELAERTQRVELVAPETARLELRVVDADGVILAHDAIVALVAPDDETSIPTRYFVSRGKVVIPHVSAARPFKLIARSLERSWRPATSTIQGPLEPGSERFVLLRFDSSQRRGDRYR